MCVCVFSQGSCLWSFERDSKGKSVFLFVCFAGCAPKKAIPHVGSESPEDGVRERKLLPGGLTLDRLLF